MPPKFISAALGMAIGRDRLNKPSHCVAVIGDGAITGGMAYEAMNCAAYLDSRLIVILNDNGEVLMRGSHLISAKHDRIAKQPSFFFGYYLSIYCFNLVNSTYLFVTASIDGIFKQSNPSSNWLSA